MINKSYCVVGGAFTVQGVMVGCLYAYGVFFNYLETDLGWSRTQLSLGMSLTVIVMGLFSIPAGRLSDKFGARWVLMGSSLFAGVGIMLLTTLSAPWQLYIFFSLMFGIGMCTHDVVTLSAVAKWFPKRRGAVSAVVKVGTATGQMIMPILVSFLILAYGWRSAFLFLGVGALFVLLIASYLTGIKPQSNPGNPQQTQSNEFTFKEACKERSVWTLCAIQLLLFISFMTIPLHIVNHAIDMGDTPAEASRILSTIAAFSVVGRMIIGFLVDRIGSKNAFLIGLLPLVISLCWILFIEDTRTLYFFAAIYGFSHGGLFTVVSPTVADLFGTRAHGTIFGMIWLFGTVGGFAGSLITGMIFDAGNSYQLAFLMMAGASFLALLLGLTLPAKKKSDPVPN
ncbi:MAG: MFS family permease [Gammaproteobacteria bacterium]